VETEAGKAEIVGHTAGEVVGAVVEQARRERDRLDAVGLDDVDGDGPTVKQTEVKELDLEAGATLAPEGAIGAKADVAPLVVADSEEPLRHLSRRLVRRLRQRLGARDDVLEAEPMNQRRAGDEHQPESGDPGEVSHGLPA
jgi:hypothetical protein